MQVTIRRMDAHPPSKSILLQHADSIMEALIAVQNTRTAVSEEVMLTFSALCLAQGYDFGKYISHITMPLLTGLARHQEYQVCRVCVNALGDIAREIKSQLLPFADAYAPPSPVNTISELDNMLTGYVDFRIVMFGKYVFSCWVGLTDVSADIFSLLLPLLSLPHPIHLVISN